MNILFVTDLCPISDDEFGLPYVILNFILNFKALGHNVTLFRPNVIPNIILRGRKLLPEGEYCYKGVKAINKNYLTPFFKPDTFDFFSKEKFDIILSHMPSGVLAAHQISKKLNIHFCAAVHSSDIKVLSDIKYSFLWHSIKQAYKASGLVLPRSYWLKDKIEKIIPDIKAKTSLIPSGINPEVIIDEKALNKKIEQFSSHPVKIFSAGSLIKRKNFDILIKSIKNIDNIELEIAGEGCEFQKLNSIIEKYNLQNKVKLLGQLSKDEIFEKMYQASIFILPSKDETFGMVYLEALSKGCITVCSENSGMAGYIKDGYNGFLTAISPNSIKSVILKILNLNNYAQIVQNARNQALLMDEISMSKNYINSIQKYFF